MVVSALDQFGPGSFLPYVQVGFIERVRYIIYNWAMALGSCLNFVKFY